MKVGKKDDTRFSEQLALASLFVLILLFSKIFPQFTGLNPDTNMIISNLPSVWMVLNLDDAFPETEVVTPTADSSFSFSQEIPLDRITFGYDGAEPLFRELSAVIPCKKITSIMGESGLGKTTLIDLIAGLQRHHSVTHHPIIPVVPPGITPLISLRAEGVRFGLHNNKTHQAKRGNSNSS